MSKLSNKILAKKGKCLIWSGGQPQDAKPTDTTSCMGCELDVKGERIAIGGWLQAALTFHDSKCLATRHLLLYPYFFSPNNQ